ncbi:pyrimidine-nucleoside phosphorylase [Melghirimyces algeriensis]|uniref:Pyrimidine-nucleoside phosphorylase n=1 Tax=Melghirimyces algeriensis TaxID=910412 RepID=A0A521B1S0_9BACL|nr:pyrimidine-nucleoside phosphorylase [Melghirimyces algeriensis]SMO40981.1 pyrimidine-nucleoside phosphorylase [Melghirimyces algeriensis]
MNTVEIIRKKRNGEVLSSEEIQYLIQGYAKGEIPDYQMSALAMAIYFRGMDSRETADLTMEMVQSGERVDLSRINGVKVDKHSTGGVGDTTTLVLAPLVAAAGVPVAKMSGRGLGHTGGTIDKLESFQGFSTSLSPESFVQQVNGIGLAVMGQTADLTPADKQLYALRDVTATVDSIPLISSSIMSKKIASGADAIVLDVKTGNGAFMKEEAQAIQLAQAMVAIGNRVGRQTVAVISDMEQPLGMAVGNALEIKEAIETLQGKGPRDLTELCLVLGAQMVVLAGKAESMDQAKETLQRAISDGSALDRFRQFVKAQGGDPRAVDHPELLPVAKYVQEVKAPDDGVITGLIAEEIGLCAMELGAGRKTKDAVIDHGVGVVLRKKIGDTVRQGEALANLYVNDLEKAKQVEKRFLQAVRISKESVDAPRLIRALVTENGVERI